MRILFSTIGSRGDVQPVLAFALQLKSLGHEVRICAPPDFQDWIESKGVTFFPLGPPVRTFAAPRPAGASITTEQHRMMAAATVETQFDTLTQAAEGCDRIVAATALQLAARSIAEAEGIPYVFAGYAPVVFPSSHHAPPPMPGCTWPTSGDHVDLWAQEAARMEELFGAAVNTRRRTLGLTAISDVRNHMVGAQPFLAADPLLAPWPDPDDQSVFQTGAWLLADDRPLSPRLQSFLDGGPPPVYFGFGSTWMPREAGQQVLTAIRALGLRAIVSEGWFEEAWIREAPGVISIPDTNFQALFPRVAAIVHHGGAGTTTAAAIAGVPHVVLPARYDQHYWAHRVQTLGIGCALPAAPLTADALIAGINQSLSREVTSRARSLAASVRLDGIDVASQKLLAPA